ncbi:MAG: DUF6457 domain-containing protein [Intrasporangiaceae bacterium]|nr:DUF6457 domain-containing protein [Intrasporangiaceae bacterium]
MSDLEHPQERWTDWMRDACEAVGVDPEQVDIVEIHHLSKQVAHRLERPLAPVSTFILGLALGMSGEAQSRDELLDRILDTLPGEADPVRPND